MCVQAKVIPLQACQACKGLRVVEAPTISRQSRHIQVTRLSALCSDRFYPSEDTPGTYFCWRMRRPQSRSAAGRTMSMKNHNDPVGNRTRDLPACSAAPPPTAPPRILHHVCALYIIFTIKHLRRQLKVNEPVTLKLGLNTNRRCVQIPEGRR